MLRFIQGVKIFLRGAIFWKADQKYTSIKRTILNNFSGPGYISYRISLTIPQKYHIYYLLNIVLCNTIFIIFYEKNTKMERKKFY